MNLSLICSKFVRSGGMEQYLLDLVNGLHQKNIKPIVYSNKFDQSLVEYTLITPKRINLSLIPKFLRNRYLSYIVNKNKSADEITLSTCFSQSNVVFCGGNHKGYLKQIHKKEKIGDRLKIMNEQRSFERSSLIIAHSNMMKNEIIELYDIPTEKIKTIYPPVNTSRFNTINDDQRHQLRNKFGFKEDEIIYLFPSTGHSRKGFDILKAYFENTELPIKLVIAGTPVKESKNIISLGYCKNMPELYQAADYTIMASNYEPFGLVGIESILSGTQIIFSDNMGCLEILKNDFGYTFPREDQNKLDEVIKKSIIQAQLAQHRILTPLENINYNPSLITHIDEILSAIA